MDTAASLQALIDDRCHGAWELGGVIGTGGMATVYVATVRATGAKVAIKVLKPEYSTNREFVARFRGEALAAEAINHPNVVRTYDYQEIATEQGTVSLIVMEYIHGESVADLIEREGSLAEPLALNVLQQAANGLAAIHSLGLIHRDIKPGNLLIAADGTVKITDFGIAKAAQAVPLTRTGMVVGTAQYVSPEQAQGLKVTPATDTYSLGVVGYELLSGQRPFTGDSSVSVAIAHINQAPPQLPQTIHPHTRELIGMALRKDPARRYADGAELAAAVAQVVAGSRPPAPQGSAAAGAATQLAPAQAAATRQLSTHVQPTTIAPAVAPAAAAVPAAARPAASAAPQVAAMPAPGNSKRFIIVVVVLAAIALGLVVALVLGALNGKSKPSTIAPVPSSTTFAPEPVVPASQPLRTAATPTTTSSVPTVTETSPPEVETLTLPAWTLPTVTEETEATSTRTAASKTKQQASSSSRQPAGSSKPSSSAAASEPKAARTSAAAEDNTDSDGTANQGGSR